MTTQNRLSRAALHELRLYGLTRAQYAQHFWDDGRWHGDTCGCPDDRCVGYHHDADEECGCLPVLAEDVAVWRRAATP